MNDTRDELKSKRLRDTLVAGLLVGAAGIALLWAGGVQFPVAVPPGILILGVTAILAAIFRNVWTAALGCLAGVFVLGGFLISGTGYEIIGGSEGGLAQVGQVIEVLGVAVAAVAGRMLAVRRAR